MDPRYDPAGKRLYLVKLGGQHPDLRDEPDQGARLEHHNGEHDNAEHNEGHDEEHNEGHDEEHNGEHNGEHNNEGHNVGEHNEGHDEEHNNKGHNDGEHKDGEHDGGEVKDTEGTTVVDKEIDVTEGEPPSSLTIGGRI
ncbi:hypothetical protein NKR23_g12255 [Pleurostoma richardsiae]|uniref:Uncharacterized protein n=1 Tax=Pleurostoma richardsiae TaxID=41990 RepID=A0AA38VAZ1_9PEZI|nr:hypothetical protein NKR23_g12255 [Pleurostoma richardsiae]